MRRNCRATMPVGKPTGILLFMFITSTLKLKIVQFKTIVDNMVG